MECTAETLDEPFFGEGAVAKLGPLVVSDDADHRAELRSHAVALRVGERT